MLKIHRGRLGLAIAGAATLSLITTTAATAAVVSNNDPVALGNSMSAVGVTGGALSVVYDCTLGPCPTGIGDSALAGFPTSGATFGVMTTGDAQIADDANIAGNSGKAWNQTGTPIAGDVWDQQVLRVDLPAATGNCLAFDFRFLSEEYPEYVTSGFNDAFVAQLDTWNVSVDPVAQTVSAPGDFAAGAGDSISVDAAGPSAMSLAEAAGTTYDGATLRLVARTPVAPGSVHSLYLTMFDQGDAILDSAVFVDGIRFENAAAGQCKSLALDPFEATTGASVAGVPTLSGTTLNIPVSCNIPQGPIGCPLTASVSFVNWGDTLPTARKATTPFASGSATIPSATTGTIPAATTTEGVKALTAAKLLPKKLKKKAKKLLKKAKKLRAKAETVGPVLAAKLLKKAAKLVKKAKKLKKRARKLLKQPLGSFSVRLTNTSNGVSAVTNVTLPR
jgi:hypothetical protein